MKVNMCGGGVSVDGKRGNGSEGGGVRGVR